MPEKDNGYKGYRAGDLVEVVCVNDGFVDRGGSTLITESIVARQTVGTIGIITTIREPSFMGLMEYAFFVDHNSLVSLIDSEKEIEKAVYSTEEIKVLRSKVTLAEAHRIWWTREIWNRCLS